jgi:hypothetical protein
VVNEVDSCRGSRWAKQLSAFTTAAAADAAATWMPRKFSMAQCTRLFTLSERQKINITNRKWYRKPVLGIRRFLGLPAPDPLVREELWIRILPFSHRGVKRIEIMLAK